MITLNGIELPYDLNWEDRYWVSVKTVNKTFSINGNVILEQQKIISGRPITLSGSTSSAWIKTPLLEQLMTLANTIDSVMTLVIESESFNVKFDSSNGDAIEATDLLGSNPFPDANWNYVVKMRFITC